MTKDKSRIQSCIDHINTAMDVDPWAKELVAEMGKEILKAQLSKEDTTSDCISRQAAIDTVQRYNFIYPEYMEWFVTKLRDAIKADLIEDLGKLPSVQPVDKDINVSCKDAISRQAAIDALTEYGNGRAVYISAEEAVRRIEQLPPAQPEIIHCKDCKWFGDIGCAIEIVDDSDKPTENDFCSYAERRTDERQT